MRFYKVILFSRSTEPTDTGEEYWYPEVEPKFDKQQLAAMFGKPPSEPTSDAMYCPPPEMDPQQVQRRSPRLQRPAFPLPKPAHVKGFSYTGSTEGNRVPGLGLGAPSLGAGRHPFQGSSPLFPHKPTDPPAVPTRKGKPLPPPKPLPRPPPLAKHVTEPILKYTPCQYEGTVCFNCNVTLWKIYFFLFIISSNFHLKVAQNSFLIF